MERTTIDLWFGAFVTAGFVALLVLALKVGNLGAERATQTYRVEARFDNIGGLKVRGAGAQRRRARGPRGRHPLRQRQASRPR